MRGIEPMKIDFGKTSADYATHRMGFPDRFYTTLLDMGVAVADTDLLDVGTGTGTLAHGFARRAARVTGIDRSDAMLDAARRLNSESDNPRFLQAKAEQTELPDASFDVITAGTCWHWFDPLRAAAEMKRLLRPHGWLVIAHLDWIPLPGNLAALTETLIRQFNPQWQYHSSTGLYPMWLADLANAGFKELQTRSFDEWIPYSVEAWRGRVRASAGIAASLSQPEVEAFDDALERAIAEQFPDDPIKVHHRVFITIAQSPPAIASL
jgi:ubiquinone/menaquinone biosynthesis C-methylase UbiE